MYLQFPVITRTIVTSCDITTLPLLLMYIWTREIAFAHLFHTYLAQTCLVFREQTYPPFCFMIVHTIAFDQIAMISKHPPAQT